jgi:hypothetical protein
MSATTLSVVTATKAGATITATSVASADTITISATTAQSALDFNTLHIRISATSAMTLSLAANATGTRWSEYGQGALSVTVASGTSVIFGGQDFESARFKNATAGSITFTVSAGSGSFEAYQSPNAFE